MTKKTKIIEINLGTLLIILGIGLLLLQSIIIKIAAIIIFVFGLILFLFEIKADVSGESLDEPQAIIDDYEDEPQLEVEEKQDDFLGSSDSFEESQPFDFSEEQTETQSDVEINEPFEEADGSIEIETEEDNNVIEPEFESTEIEEPKIENITDTENLIEDISDNISDNASDNVLENISIDEADNLTNDINIDDLENINIDTTDKIEQPENISDDDITDKIQSLEQFDDKSPDIESVEQLETNETEEFAATDDIDNLMKSFSDDFPEAENIPDNLTESDSISEDGISLDELDDSATLADVENLLKDMKTDELESGIPSLEDSQDSIISETSENMPVELEQLTEFKTDISPAESIEDIEIPEVKKEKKTRVENINSDILNELLGESDSDINDEIDELDALLGDDETLGFDSIKENSDNEQPSEKIIAETKKIEDEVLKILDL